jgi:hypothetical protein
MFTRVNARCAHRVRPPEEVKEQTSLNHVGADRNVVAEPVLGFPPALGTHPIRGKDLVVGAIISGPF